MDVSQARSRGRRIGGVAVAALVSAFVASRVAAVEILRVTVPEPAHATAGCNSGAVRGGAET
jgi:hypothetical protein